MSAKIVRSATAGQSAKSALTIPVVVMIETAWKKPVRTASSPSLIPYPQTWTAMGAGRDRDE